MNRRDFLARVALGGAAAAGVAAVVGAGSVAGALGDQTGRLGNASSAEAATGPGVELVVNGSFEDGPPGVDIVGWQELV